MIIIPAIDILDGRVARLIRGDFSFEKTYDGSPFMYARKWEEMGAEMIHIVDLNGARSGVFKNMGLISEIVSSVKASIELGGGLRDIQTIEEALKIGVARVIVGTRAIDKDFVKRTIEKFGYEKIVVGVDSKDGKVALSGWTKTSDISIYDFLKELELLGVRTIVFTDIQKDGTLSGPNIEALDVVLNSTGMEVVASGGISSIDDILNLKRLEERGLVGCIVGKALYEGRLDLREAINAAK